MPAATFRHPSPRARLWATWIITAVASVYLLFTGLHQHRDLFPKYHDDHMHMLQVQHLAHFRLWYPQHPLADFFETFHIFVKPVYASVYFPGTALLYAPTVWLHLPYWIAATIVAGAAVGIFYRVVTELLDGLYGALAALLLISLTMFRHLSLMVMSHSVMLFLGLAILWAYLSWRAKPSLARAAVIGALCGWAAITRPVDALCYAIPVGVAMGTWLLKQPRREIWRTVLVVVVGASPFLCLQLVFNRGVTGQWLRTPYRMYADMFTPQMSFGFHDFDPNVRPQTTLPQRVIYYDDFTVPAARAHRLELVLPKLFKERLPRIAAVDLPNVSLLVLVPFGLLALRGARWILVSVLLLYIFLYSFFAYLLPHYVIVVAPAVLFLVLLGMHELEATFARARSAVVVICTLAIVGLSLRQLPEINRNVRDDINILPLMTENHELPKHVQIPAIVLFRYGGEDDDPYTEPVYNVDVAWPDDAPIIRAQDLGDQRNRDLFKYYAERQPQRHVYLYDRADWWLYDLGNVAAVAATQPTR